MKYVVILGDGMADYPVEALGGKTPLQVARKPHIDELSRLGETGLVKTVPDGMKPGSDVANLAVMGYDPQKCYTGRSPLEALSMGVKMADDDIAVRCNLVTLSDEKDYEDKRMLDYSGGEISTSEAALLIAEVQKAFGDELHEFVAGVSYRHCLIRHRSLTGTNYTPPHDISDKPIKGHLPSGRYGEEALALMKASYELLKDHPVNKKRVAEGKRQERARECASSRSRARRAITTPTFPPRRARRSRRSMAASIMSIYIWKRPTNAVIRETSPTRYIPSSK